MRCAAEKIVAIACGYNHSGAVTGLGTAFTWGNGSNGRLGIFSLDFNPKPTRVVGMRAALAQSGQVRERERVVRYI